MPDFYLGAPEACWLGRLQVPLFVSRLRLQRIRPEAWPRAVCRFAIDSGAYSELSQHGRWRTTAADYVAFIRQVCDLIGRPDFVSPQDHMCEPDILARTGRTLAAHQAATVENFGELREQLGRLVIPVLQGYGPADYDRCADLYAAAGFDLASEPRVGLGSVCRRSRTAEATRLVRYVADRGLHLHAFGIKGDTWRACHEVLASADSMAWSFGARRRGLDPNAAATALDWRSRLLAVRSHIPRLEVHR